jgi:hypothetical protein
MGVMGGKGGGFYNKHGFFAIPCTSDGGKKYQDK